MRREEFETYLGKKVEIKLFDGKVITGVLRKTQDEAFKDNPNLYLPYKYYFLTSVKNSELCASVLFKVSHVKRFKVVK